MGDQGFIDFVAHLLEVNPKKRPSASEALKHPWLSYPYEPISAWSGTGGWSGIGLKFGILMREGAAHDYWLRFVIYLRLDLKLVCSISLQNALKGMCDFCWYICLSVPLLSCISFNYYDQECNFARSVVRIVLRRCV